MKSFIKVISEGKHFIIATSAIVSITPNGEGSFITLNAAVDGFDPISKGAAVDVPFEDVESWLAADTTELRKRGRSRGTVI